VLQSCRRVLLGVFMLANRVMVLCLMVVMRGGMVVRSGVVMVLACGVSVPVPSGNSPSMAWSARSVSP
jgi:hypothetical protein